MPVKTIVRYNLEMGLPRLNESASFRRRRSALTGFLAACHRRRYPSKTPIIRPGDDARTLYYVIEGSLSVMSEDDEGHELILAYLNPGDFIGEMGLFMDSDRREVLVRTRTSCELAEISYERLFALFEGGLSHEAQEVLLAIGAQLTQRLLQTSRKVSRLAFLDVAQRVARTLLDLCNEPDALSHPQGTQLRISRQEISRIVGCSREMVGRVLKQLEESEKISVSGKTIVVFGIRETIQTEDPGY